MKIIINRKTYEFKEGATILEVARENGISIPTLCYLKELGALTSCFVCLVEVAGKINLVPSCAARAEDSMVVFTESEKVKKARKTALELLLSDHTGDCVGPCHTGCPAHINIPKFIKEFLLGDNRAAIMTIKESVALPAVLGRICPEVCEKVCRRRQKDEAVAICHLKRYVADIDLASPFPYVPEKKTATGKKVAIIGAGPSGLTAAYFLQRDGYETVVFDKNEKPGGVLRYLVSKKRLSDEVLDKEINIIRKLGVSFRQNSVYGKDITLTALVKEYDAVFLAAGSKKEDLEHFEKECIKVGDNGFEHDKNTYETAVNKVFAGPKTSLAVRASVVGREAAYSIDRFLRGEKPEIKGKPFTTKLGKISEENMNLLMRKVSETGRVLKCIVDMKTLKDNPGEARVSFTAKEAKEEALRCMRCDCRKADKCLLKKHSEEEKASPDSFKGARRAFAQDLGVAGLVYESGKCISCGICIKICEKNKEVLGFTFIGRGFNVKIAVPYEKTVAEGVLQAANECAEKCPTGAISKANYE